MDPDIAATKIQKVKASPFNKRRSIKCMHSHSLGGVCGQVVNTLNSRSGGHKFKPHPLHCFLRLYSLCLGRHLIPSTKLTSSSHKTFHFSYMKFLDEMFIKVKVSSIFKEKKQFRIERVGFELRASDLECITLTPKPPRIW